MPIRKTSLTWFAAIVAAIILLFVSCKLSAPITYIFFLGDVDTDPNGGDFFPEDYYKIDAASIIQSLDQGKKDVFTLAATMPEGSRSESIDYFHWYQLDFIKVAAALSQYAGGDNINDWKILTVSFRSTCEINNEGFSTGYFILFRPIWLEDQLSYEAREIFINPSKNIVRWGDGNIYPRPLFGWSRINLDEFKITAEEALRIAEENGGKQARMNMKNDCFISVIGQDNYWLVSYSNFVAEFHVDAYTGKVKYIRDE